MFNNNITGLQVDSFRLIETNHNYVDMYNKCYTVDASASTVMSLQNVFGNNILAGRRVNDNLIASSVPGIINISNPLHVSTIANGWNNNRLTFQLQLSYSQNSIYTIMLVQGYTDYVEVSYNGTLDPNITFYINKIQEFRQIIQRGQYVYTPYNSYNVLYDIDGTFSVHDNNRATSLRPVDIYNKIHTDLMLESSMDNSTVYDFSNDITGTPKASKTSNNNPVTYITTLLNSYTSGKNSAIGVSSDPIDTFHGIASAAEMLESDLHLNPLFRSIVAKTNLLTPYFKADLLESIDPNVSFKTEILTRAKQAMVATFEDTTNIANFYSNTIDSTSATLIDTMLTTYLLDYNVGAIKLAFTNATNPANIAISVINFNIPLDDATKQIYTENIRYQIANVILPTVTYNNSLLIEAEVSITLTTDSIIKVRINNDSEVIYRFPTFANNRYVPVVGSNVALQNTSHNLSTIIESCL